VSFDELDTVAVTHDDTDSTTGSWNLHWQQITELLATGNAPGDYCKQDPMFQLSKNDPSHISFVLHLFPTKWLHWFGKNKDNPHCTVMSGSYSDMKNLATYPIPEVSKGCYFHLMKMSIQQAKTLTASGPLD
jgi:hypothetical protein